MDSTTRTITHNFTFAGTIDELVNLVRDWRALLPGDDDRDGRLHYLSRSYLTNQPGWEMGSHNPDTFTTRRLSEHERVHLGKVKPVEDGGAIRRVTLDVSLIRWEEKEEAWSLAGKPASMHWRYHREHFGALTLAFQQKTDGVKGWLQFPDVVKEECTRLLTMISMWKPDQTTQAGREAAPVGDTLTADERNWYETLLACKDAYGNGTMTWQQIGDRRGVSAKTAKRRLRELQARRLPGLDDWPDRTN